VSSDKMAESAVTDSAVIRAALRPHGPKRLARLMDVPVRTAKHWLYHGPSSRRRREMALALLAEMEREEVERTAICRVLAQWAAEL